MELDTNKTQEQLDQEWKDQCMIWCREERDKLLAATDYIHLPDVTVDSDYRVSILTYRQQLRDFPASYETSFDALTEDQKGGVTPQSIVYPTKPSN